MTAQDKELIYKFIDDGLIELNRLGLMTKSGNFPKEMKDESFDRSQEYNKWKAIESTVTDSDIKELEGIVNCELPNSFKTFLKYKHFYKLWLPRVMEVTFFSHPIYSWKKNYSTFYSYDWVQEDLIEKKFIPFANHEDWGFLCFDARKSYQGNEYPILMVDQELVGDQGSYKEFNNDFMDMVKNRLLYKK
jgi:hypothetical protein